MMTYKEWLESVEYPGVPSIYWEIHSEEERIKNIYLHLNDLSNYIQYLSEFNEGVDKDLDEIEQKMQDLTDAVVNLNGEISFAVKSYKGVRKIELHPDENSAKNAPSGELAFYKEV